MHLIKSHAFGNDFLLVEEREVAGVADIQGFARAVCERHRGIGADGLLIFGAGVGGTGGTTMRLLNADGSPSEISGNGLRCLAAWLARRDGGQDIEVTTGAGLKRLQLLDRTGARYTFRAAMGQPEELTQEEIAVGSSSVTAITLRVGNPQCVVLGDVTTERLHTLASALAVHPRFPAGTNVELAAVEAPQRVRILIWERGVGPTEASGTGACAAAVAAMAYGGAARTVDVISPGGSQQVEWREDGLYLTGWAELVGEVRWLADAG